MASTCPWCLERLSFRYRKASVCPHCGRPLRPQDSLDNARPIDVHYSEIDAQLHSNYRGMMTYGSWAILCFLLLAQATHLAAPFLGHLLLTPIPLVGHMVACRWLLLREPRRLMSIKRRFFTRWITRLAFISLGVVGYSLAAIPILGVFIGVGTYAGITSLVFNYTAWSLRREHDRLPLAVWEKLLFALLVLLAIAALVLLCLIVAGVVWLVGEGPTIWEWLCGAWTWVCEQVSSLAGRG